MDDGNVNSIFLKVYLDLADVELELLAFKHVSVATARLTRARGDLGYNKQEKDE